MRITVKIRRRVWLRFFIGLVTIAAIIAVATVYFGGRTNPAAPNAVATPTSSPASEIPVAVDAAPTGCLGGPDRTAAMVLAAQQTAPHTTNGAIEVAAAYVRWLNQYPYPSTADADAVSLAGLAQGAPTKDIRGFFATNPNLSGGLVPDSTSFYLSTVPGVWHLEKASEEEVVATIGAGLVIEGALSPTLKGSITVTLNWEDGQWKFDSSVGTRTTQDLYSIGTPFTGGC